MKKVPTASDGNLDSINYPHHNSVQRIYEEYSH